MCTVCVCGVCVCECVQCACVCCCIQACIYVCVCVGLQSENKAKPVRKTAVNTNPGLHIYTQAVNKSINDQAVNMIKEPDNSSIH